MIEALEGNDSHAIYRRGFLVGALSAGALNATAGALRAQEGGSAPAPSLRADWLIDPSSYLAKVDALCRWPRSDD